MRTELILRFDYGRTIPWVSRLPDGTFRAIAGPDMVTLHSPVAVRGEDMITVGEFEVAAGETVPFVLTHGASHLPPPTAVDPVDALATTESFWQQWTAAQPVARPLVGGRDPIAHHLEGADLRTHRRRRRGPDHLAAGAARRLQELGLPLLLARDATLTLLALMNAGYYDEAGAWRDWLLRAAAGAPSQLQIMYGLAGERRLTEFDVPWLPGYEGSLPVRIGNAAHGQLQLDVFGEVMDALHQARRGGLDSRPEDWAFQCAMLEHLTTVWEQPDEGIWEVRGGARQFTYSKVMAWVAMDRGIRAVETLGVEGPADRWRAVRQAIHEQVCRHGFDPELGSFVQAYGSKELDASLLLLPSVGFLPATDPRMRGTIEAVERRLFVDGFLLRYDTATSPDGLPPREGAFLACSFWLADAYVLLGRIDDAERLFERLLALRNDVGLLAEEYDTDARRLVGNFPQAFSHVALVNTAHNLARSAKPAEQRST